MTTLPHSTDWHINQIRNVVTRAQAALGKLTQNQRIDLVLDQCDWIKDSQEADRLLARAGFKSCGCLSGCSCATGFDNQ